MTNLMRLVPPRGVLIALQAALAAAAGCGAAPLDGDPAAGQEAPSFLAINRAGEGEAGQDVAVRTSQLLAQMPSSEFNPDEAFYLAIHRRELGKRWFMSAYLKQFFPGAVLRGAARSLGTRVVTFKIQNGNLYVVDVDDRKQASDTFAQDLIFEAYPIVNARQLAGVRLVLDDYVIIDPAAGRNEFGVMGDFYGGGGFDRLKVELAMSQRFRRLADGASFEQVFTAYSDKARSNNERVENNFFRVSGVLGLAFRRYQESEGFTPTPPPPVVHYFLGDNRLVPNAGRVVQRVAKWNIRPGMKPIKWLISPLAQRVQDEDPEVRAAGIDLVGAIKSGIESWNSAFGFPVLEAELASPVDSFADDDKNYLVYDVNRSAGFAFANWRTNPNTGEIRGASVYFNHVFVTGAIDNFADDPIASTPPPVPPAGSPAASRLGPTLAWEPFADGEAPCDISPRRLDPIRRELAAAVPGTPRGKIEKAIAHTVAHEIGHTLGLRHNFKGSLVPPSSSVMDYLSDPVAVQADLPAAYDVDAVRYLYGLSPSLPQQPFCNDSGIASDARCDQFDETADPLALYHAPPYQQVVALYLITGDSFFGFLSSLFMTDLIRYTRLGITAAERLSAWSFTVEQLRVAPAPPAQVSPAVVLAVNSLMPLVVNRLVPPPPPPGSAEAAAAAANPPRPLDAAVQQALVVELRGNLLNTDGLRSFATRRLVVDALKRLQRPDAHQALRDARPVLQAQALTTASPADRALLDDLAARVERALSPYFDS